MSAERIRPFSNGSEYGFFVERNCDRCCKSYVEGVRKSRCSIEKALNEASFSDGTILRRIYARMGGSSGYCPERAESLPHRVKKHRAVEGQTNLFEEALP